MAALVVSKCTKICFAVHCFLFRGAPFLVLKCTEICFKVHYLFRSAPSDLFQSALVAGPVLKGFVLECTIGYQSPECWRSPTI
jgi:hypothetical protein